MPCNIVSLISRKENVKVLKIDDEYQSIKESDINTCGLAWNAQPGVNGLRRGFAEASLTTLAWVEQDGALRSGQSGKRILCVFTVHNIEANTRILIPLENDSFILVKQIFLSIVRNIKSIWQFECFINLRKVFEVFIPFLKV